MKMIVEVVDPTISSFNPPTNKHSSFQIFVLVVTFGSKLKKISSPCYQLFSARVLRVSYMESFLVHLMVGGTRGAQGGQSIKKYNRRNPNHFRKFNKRRELDCSFCPKKKIEWTRWAHKNETLFLVLQNSHTEYFVCYLHRVELLLLLWHNNIGEPRPTKQ